MKIRTKLLAVFLFVSVLALAVTYLSLVQLRRVSAPLDNDIPESIERLSRTVKLDGLLQLARYYGEILSQSARSYAFTQDRIWEQRYFAFMPQLEEVVLNAVERGDASNRHVFEQLEQARLALLSVEREALAHVRADDALQAIQLLEDEKYRGYAWEFETALRGYSLTRGLHYEQAFESSALAVRMAAKDAQRIVQRTIYVLSLVSLIVVAVAAAGAIFVTRWIVRPLNQLGDYMRGVSEGDLSRRATSTTNDEIGRLARSYDQMVVQLEKTTVSRDELVREVERRRHAEEELKNREVHIHAILDSVPDAILALSESGIVDSANPAVERTFGYSASDVVGKDIRMLLSASSLPEFEERGNTRTPGARYELEGKRKDGNILPIELSENEMQMGKTTMRIVVVRDITERREVDRMKNEFISTVSHELRTPLTSIRGSLGLILGGAIGELPEKLKSMIDIAHKNSERLTNLINDILDIEKIESGRMDFTFRPVQIMRLVEQSVEANRSYGSQFDVDFLVEEGVEEALVNADPERMMQVMGNLLSNAAKFSPQGASVSIRVVRHTGALRVAVTDAGPGIPKEFRSRVFQRFAQADSSSTRKKGGTGLGLNISKAIVERHEGRIGFETIEGGGTTFFFDLPEWRPAGLEESLPAGSEHKARVLICEDDRDIGSILRAALETSGYVTDIARTAEGARRLLDQHSYDAMTLDILLPDQDGISLIQGLQNHDNIRDLPIVVVSGQPQEQGDELDGGLPNLVEWLVKPIDVERFLAAIEIACAGNRLGRPRILHVEDDMDVIRFVAAVLETSAEVVFAVDLKEARARIAEERFDLVVLDVELPDGSGLDILPELDNRVPVVVFSAQEVDDKITEQVKAVLVKSRTSNEQLTATIRSHIQGTQR